MTLPTASDVHIDQALTNISVALLQDPTSFVSYRVFQNVPVQKQSDKYFTFPRSYFNRKEARKRAPGTEGPVIEFSVSNDSYFCEERMVSVKIPDQIRANADTGVAYDQAVAQLLTHQMLIEKEDDWATTFFTSGVWGTDVTGVAATPATGQALQWNDATSTPIEDVRTARRTVTNSTGLKPNVMVINGDVYDALVDHPDIQDRIKGGTTPGNPSIANRNVLAEIFEIDEILVSEAIENTAAEGATASHSTIMGKNALLTYRPSSPGLITPAAGYTFSWSGYLGGVNEFGFVADLKREDRLDSDFRRARSHYDHKLVSSELGYFFSGIVA